MLAMNEKCRDMMRGIQKDLPDVVIDDAAVLKVAERAMSFMQERDFVSFVELGRVDGFKCDEGDMCVGFGDGGALLWWLPPVAACAMRLLLAGKHLCIRPANKLIYLVDGEICTDERWFPVTLRSGAHANFMNASGYWMCLDKKDLKNAARWMKETESAKKEA